ncbi:MAG TPA: ATP-binding protein [Burkholderiaceae bacterium]
MRNIAASNFTWLSQSASRILPHLGFVAAYVLLDWLSFIEPMHGFNITTWNPPPALGFVYWLSYGRVAALPWFFALLIAEGLVRSFPAGWGDTLMLSVCLTFGYGCIAEILRRNFRVETVFGNRRELSLWFVVVGAGALLNALVYVSLLHVLQLLPDAEWLEALRRYWLGDLVGVMISMPIFWLLASGEGRNRLWQVLRQWETLGFCLLMAALIWFTFAFYHRTRFHHFYFLFLPIVWAASRQGIVGAALIAGLMQLNIIAATASGFNIVFPLGELQLLLSMLALVSLFIGIVVEEQKATALELNRSMRLTAAGEIAAALAHELNQPITAMVAYGKSCTELIARNRANSEAGNDSGKLFREVVERMVGESNRAASVVRRIKELFQTGAMEAETVELDNFLEQTALPFSVQARQLGVQFELGPVPRVQANLDRLQIELVLRNLLQNAFEAVAAQPEGKRRVRLTLETEDAGKLVFCVSDSGPGVAPAMRAGLFEPFVTSKSSGMGVGLAISRSIVEAHGGKLWAEFPAHGTFKFSLPSMEANTVNVK